MNSDVRVLEFDDYDEVLVEEAVSQKATRSDDAGIAVHWWDNRIQQKLTEHCSKRENLEEPQYQNYGRNFEDPVAKFEVKRVLRGLRKFALKVWKSYLSEDFASWFEEIGKRHEEQDQIAIAGQEAVDRALKASWWEWDYGLSLFFWRWPEDY